MNKSIYRHEFHYQLRSVATWSLSLLLLLFVFLSIFPSFSKEVDAMNKILANFPPELKQAFGMTDLDLSTVEGYFSLCFIFCQLCLAIQAAKYGFGLVSKEEAELTADFLLTKPVSRARILISKILASLSSLVITNLVVWIGSFVFIELFKDGRQYQPKILILLLGSILIFQLFFFSLGLVISLLVRRIRSVTPYSLGLAFGMYMLNAFSGVFNDVKLEYLTAFRHFDAAAIVQQGKYNLPLVLINISVILLSLIGSYWLYTRRDIPAVV